MHGRHATTSLFASVVGWLLQGLVNQLCRLSSLALRNHDTPMTKLQQQRQAGQPTPNPLQLPFMLIQVWPPHGDKPKKYDNMMTNLLQNYA